MSVASADSPPSAVPPPGRSGPGRVFVRIGVTFLLFALLALPLVRMQGADSPAMLARAEHLDVRYAIVGDSRAHVALSPTKISEAMRAEALAADGYNFAVDGTDVLHQQDFVARGLLGTGTRPRVIVWAPNPLGFNDKRVNNRLEQLARMDLGVLRRAGAPLELELDLLTMRVFPPYRQRPLVAAKISELAERAGKKSLKAQTSVLGLTYEEPPRSREYLAQPDGHEPFKVLDWKDRFDRGTHGYEADYAGLGATRWHLEIARELIRSARAAHVVLVVLDLPVSDLFRERFARDVRHVEWHDALVKMVREAGAIYLDHSARYTGNDEQRFGDPAHMSEATAYQYSAWLGGELAQEPAVRAALAPR